MVPSSGLGQQILSLVDVCVLVRVRVKIQHLAVLQDTVTSPQRIQLRTEGEDERDTALDVLDRDNGDEALPA